MSAATHAPVEELTSDDEHEAPWWRDRAVMVPIASGAAFVAGVASEWSGAPTAATVLFWVGLLLGASTFVPGALRRLATGKLGISLLMTMSASGAVILHERRNLPSRERGRPRHEPTGPHLTAASTRACAPADA